jgi:hypothetical protein
MADIEPHAEQVGEQMAQAKTAIAQELCNAKLSCCRQSEAAIETIPVADENPPLSCFQK